MFGPFGWTKGGPHKHKLTRFYPKLEPKRALLYKQYSIDGTAFSKKRKLPPYLRYANAYIVPYGPVSGQNSAPILF